jgi:hypothetical protein
VQSARGAARRAQCANNLKFITLGMLNHEATYGTLPKPAIVDKAGKPLLSWRVAILPFIEQGPLYNKFHHDEPWDSPHNKALIKEMPSTFVCPERPDLEPYTTTYRVFTGPGALFEKGQDTGIRQVTDGTANTLMVVEAKESVPWTKPDASTPRSPTAPCGSSRIRSMRTCSTTWSRATAARSSMRLDSRIPHPPGTSASRGARCTSIRP